MKADRAVERGIPWVLLDVVVALLSAGIAIGPSDYTASLTGGPWVTRGAVVVWFLAIALRRFAPATAVWAAALATVAVVLAGEPVTNLSLASALPLTMIAQGRRTAVGLQIAIAPVTAVLVALAFRPLWAPAVAVHAGAWLAGAVSRARKLREEALRRDAEEERTRRVLAEERSRMARELHDAVGHAVTVMVTHAGAARLALPPADATAQTLGRIEQMGRHAMADLDRVLGLLSGTVDLPAAVRELTANLPSDLHADLELADDLDDLDPTVAETARRIVQEALTNVLRHATATRVKVTLAYDGTDLLITVTDNGRSGRPAPPGRGITGMRERAERLGGHLRTAPSDDGWQVHAVLKGLP